MCVITGTFPLLVTGTFIYINQAHKNIVAHIVASHVGDVLLLLHVIKEYNKVHVWNIMSSYFHPHTHTWAHIVDTKCYRLVHVVIVIVIRFGIFKCSNMEKVLM